MTLEDLLLQAGQAPWVWVVLGVFLGTPVLAWMLALMHGKDGGRRGPYPWLYSALVYAVCVPGISVAVILGYMLLFVRRDLLQVNIITTLLPVASMVVTLLIIGRRMRFADIPGFHRLSGLMTLLGVTFALVLVLEKMRIWVVFVGGIGTLVLIVGALFALLKWGSYALFRRSDEPERDLPEMPEIPKF
jgi:hypothetical protein